MGKSFSFWERMSNKVSDADINSGVPTTFGSKLKDFQSQHDQQQQLQQQQLELGIQDSRSCLNLKKCIEELEMEIETLRQEILVSTKQEKLEKEQKQKDLQQLKLQHQGQLAQLQQLNRLAQPQLLDQQRDIPEAFEHRITLQNVSFTPNSENVPLIDLAQTEQRTCNMVVGEGDGNSGYKRVKRIVCNLKDWVSKVVCCCDVVVRGRLKTGKVELVVVVGAAIAFLVYGNQIYSNAFGTLTTKTQLGALVQKHWIMHAVLVVGVFVFAGLFGVCMLLWTIRWMLKILGKYDEANGS